MRNRELTDQQREDAELLRFWVDNDSAFGPRGVVAVGSHGKASTRVVNYGWMRLIETVHRGDDALPVLVHEVTAAGLAALAALGGEGEATGT